MIKKNILIFLLLASICLSGCTDKPEPIEYGIIRVDMINITTENSIRQYDFNIMYVDDEGYIKCVSTSKHDTYNTVKLKLSDNEEYKLFGVGHTIGSKLLELHIPQNKMKML